MYEKLIGELHIVASGVQSKRRRALLEKAADAIEDLEFACNHYEKDYKALCAYLPKWIPVTERLPRDLQTVLVVRNDGGIYCWMYSACSPTDEVWVDEYANAFSVYDTTHWMPLPEPPKEET